MKYCKKNETLVKSFQKQKLLSVNKRWQVKLGNNFMCLYSDLQSATKWLETLRPKLGFFHFTDFKRGKYSFSSPIPSMQCCVTVQATYRKQQTPQLWMDKTGEVWILLFSEVTLFENNVSTILLLIATGLVLVSYICFKSKWQLTNKLNNVYYKDYIHTQSLVLSFAASLYTSRAALWRARRKLKRLTKLLISTWHRGLM